MATELEPIVRQLFRDLDDEDFDAVTGYFASDVQGIEEVERRWMRGSSEFKAYFEKVKPLVTQIGSDVEDFAEHI
jgi:hypothetical protein